MGIAFMTTFTIQYDHVQERSQGDTLRFVSKLLYRNQTCVIPNERSEEESLKRIKEKLTVSGSERCPQPKLESLQVTPQGFLGRQKTGSLGMTDSGDDR
jgi:hypothetical protein